MRPLENLIGHARDLSYFVAALVTGGCVAGVPIAGTAPKTFGDDQTTAGMTTEQVIERLGKPTWRYRNDDMDHMLYERTGNAYEWPIIWAPWPVPMPMIVDVDYRSTRWCLLLTFDRDGKMKERNLVSEVAEYSGRSYQCFALLQAQDDLSQLLESRADNGDVQAAIDLTETFNDPGALRRLAWKGDATAAFELARRFDDRGPLRKLAEKSVTAAAELARWFDEPGPLEEFARSGRGDPEEQYQVGYSAGHFDLSWPWYCLAAKQGHAKAQYALGNYYLYGVGRIPADRMKAYIWYKLAESSGLNVGERDGLYYGTESGMTCCTSEDRTKYALAEMTSSQITEANRLLSEWHPETVECSMLGRD